MIVPVLEIEWPSFYHDPHSYAAYYQGGRYLAGHHWPKVGQSRYVNGVPQPVQAGPIGTTITTDSGQLWSHTRYEPFELPYGGTR